MRISLVLGTLLFATISLFAQTSCGTVTDFEGNTYKTVQIGSQCWMAENLRTRHYADGRAINKGLRYSDGKIENTDASSNTPYWYYPNGDVSYIHRYGLLYNWEAALRACPKGWHLPTDKEWEQLGKTVGNNYGCNGETDYNAKALSAKNGWKTSNNSCHVGYEQQKNNNVSGFSALPAGAYNNNNSKFTYFGESAFFWSASEEKEVEDVALSQCLFYNSPFLGKILNGWQGKGFSVRCVSDKSVGKTAKTVEVPNEKQNNNSKLDNTQRNTESHENEKQNNNSKSDNTQRNTESHENAKQNDQKTNITSTPPAKSSCGTVEDYDGNTYKTVQIGKQCWMAENLRTTHYPDGKEIAKGTVSDKKSNLGYKYNTSYNKGYWYYPNGGPAGPGVFWSTLDYGYLYNWKAAMGNANKNASNSSRVQGICPKGWHLPSWSEWEQLVNYVYNQPMFYCNMEPNVGKALASEYEWEKSDCNKTDESQIGNPKYPNNTTGFNAFPAGEYYQGSFPVMFYGSRACYWSSSEESENSALYLKLSYCSSYTSDPIPPHDVLKHEGLSVRCLRD